MKCPNCKSQMFVADETVTQKSHVTFFRCSLCVSEHVSSSPVIESLNEPLRQRAGELLGQTITRVQYAV
jgi:hypothetical protein